MNVPAIAKKTFEELKNQTEFIRLFNFVIDSLKSIPNAFTRADLIHRIVDELNQEPFSHPLVKQMSPCTKGCSACCHTQVSVTDDEAEVLTHKVLNGLEIDKERLRIQYAAENDDKAFFKLPYEERRCVFLDEAGACKVYEDRPSVCRTNLVLGTAEQCDTSLSIQNTRLVKTAKSDMAICASFLFARSSGSLSYMLGKRLDLDEE